MALNAGADIDDVEQACAGLRLAGEVPSGDAWARAWSAVAEKTADQARRDEERGRPLSASHKLRRAAVMYALAERYLDPVEPDKLKMYEAMVAAFGRYVALGQEPVHAVEIPYQGSSLPAFFIPAGGDGDDPRPTVIFIDGLDTYKEMMYLRRGDAARERGLGLLVVDTPGVGAALRERGLTARPDTEVPVGACIEYLSSRPDVDPARLGLLGVSLGGYYAPRAAACDPRIAACAAWGAVFDAGELYRELYQPGRVLSAPAAQLQWVTGASSLSDALDLMSEFRLDQVIAQLRAPLLVLHGGDDHLVPWSHAQRLADAATSSPRVDLIRGGPGYGGSGHCSMDGLQSGVDILFDWFADVLDDGRELRDGAIGASPAACRVT